MFGRAERKRRRIRTSLEEEVKKKFLGESHFE